MDSRVAIVTGAASGIGRATVERFLSSGMGVVAGDVGGADWSWARGRARLATLTADVTSASGNVALVEAAVTSFGRIDVAVLNAGVAGGGDLVDQPIEQFDRIMEVNVRGVVLGLKAVLPRMRTARGGAVVITASVSGLGADPGMWAYNASKAGVLNLMRAAAYDNGRHGIRVNAVCPGPTHTGMTNPLRERRPDWYEELRRHVPLQRWGDADEVAAVIEFLASPNASFVTGVALPVDGGISAGSGQFLPRQLASDQ